MERSILKRVASLMLAVVMMLSVIVILPESVEAATTKTITGKGKQTVTISNKKCYGSTGKYYWIKFKAKENGYVTIEANKLKETKPATGNWVLYDSSKKKQLSSTFSYAAGSFFIDNWKAYYGVKKNTVYYLRVKANEGTKIKATFKSQKETGGKTQSKAQSLTKGKTVTGVIFAGSKRDYWYKVKLNSAGKLNVDFTPYFQNPKVTVIALYFFDSRIAEYTVWESGMKSSLSTWWDYTLPKGTYYIKVESTNPKKTGYFTLKWKK